MFFRRLLYFLLLILLPVLSVYPEALYSQENELEKANVLNEKVELLYKQGRYTDALPLAQQILEIRKNVLGPEHTDTAESLNNLAMLCCSLGDYPTRPAFEKFMDGISINIFLKATISMRQEKLLISDGKEHLTACFRFDILMGCQIVLR